MSGVGSAISGALGGIGSALGDNINRQNQSDTTSFGTGTQTGTGTSNNITQSTPFLQWLATQTANGTLGTALSGNTAGNALINQSAGVTPGQVASYADPRIAQESAAVLGALKPGEEDARSYLLGSMSGQPSSSARSGAYARLLGQQGATEAAAVTPIVQQGWGQASSTALGSQGLTQGAGTALNSQQLAALGQVPAYLNSAGNTNVGTGATTNNQATTQQGTQHQVGSSTQQGYNGGDILGGGLALGADALAFLKHGGAVKGYYAGGAIPGYSLGGAPQPMGGTAGPGAEGTPMPPFMSGPMPPTMAAPMAAPPPQVAMGQPPAPVMPFSGQLAPQGGNAPGAPPNPMLPRLASGGVVAGSGGPSGDDFSSKVMSAFKTFHSMRKHAQDGGVMAAMPSDASWTPVVEKAPDMGWMPTVQPAAAAPAQSQGILPKFQAWLGSHSRQPQPAAQPQAPEPDALAQQANSLRTFMGGMFKPQQPTMGAADGGSILPPFGARRHFERGGEANYSDAAYGPAWGDAGPVPDLPDADVATARPLSTRGDPYAPPPDAPPADLAEKLLATAGYNSGPFDAPAPRRGAPLYAEPSLYAHTPSTGGDYLRKAAYTISNMGGRGKVAEGIMKAREDERAAYADARAERQLEGNQFGSVDGRQTMAGEMHQPALTVAQVNARAALEQEKYNQQYRAWLASQEKPTPASGPGAAIPQARYNTASPSGGGAAPPAAPELPPGVPPPPTNANDAARVPDAIKQAANAAQGSVLDWVQTPDTAKGNWEELKQGPHGPAIAAYFEQTGQQPRNGIEAARMLVAGAQGAAAPAPPSGAPSAQRAAGLPADAGAAPGQAPPAAPSAPPDMTLDNVAPPQTARAPIIQDPDQREAYARLMSDKERLNKMIQFNQPGADALDKRIMEAEKMKMYPVPGKGFVPLPGYAEGEARAAAMKTGADKIAEENAKYHTSLSKGIKGAATVAANQAQNIDVLEKVMADPNFQSGTLVNWNVATRKALATAGYNPDASKPNEVFNMIMGKVLQDQFAGLKSLSSEAGEAASRVFAPMLAIEEKSLPHESDSLEGKRMKVALLKNMGELQMRWANKVNQYEAKNGSLDPNFDMALRNEIAKARIVAGVSPQDEQRALTALQAKEGGATGAPAAGGAPAPIMTLEQARSLPPGPITSGPFKGSFKIGDQIVPPRGKLGEIGNPHADAGSPDVEAGHYAYRDGELYQRTPNYLFDRWKKATTP